jgi:asparagine N-glycosylation enzyme membrane subunit Stt3
MSKAILEAIVLSVMAAVLVAVAVVGVQRRNGWEYVAPPFVVVLLVLVWFNLKGYVFGGPGFTIHPPEGK